MTTDSNKRIARYLRSTIGKDISISAYQDEGPGSRIDIASAKCIDFPDVVFHSTIGLSDYFGNNNASARANGFELIFTAYHEFKFAAAALSTFAFNVINDKMKIGSGIIFDSVLTLYRTNPQIKHVLFVEPFLLDFRPMDLPDKQVDWLLAVPISDSERKHADKNGSYALQELFDDAQIDIFDLDRSPVI